MAEKHFVIAVSGFAGSGKNTVGERIAEQLSLPVVAPTFKMLAQEEGVSLMEFQEMAKNDLSIDYKFDAALARSINEGSCIACTWICPWIDRIAGKEWGGVKIAPVKARIFRAWLDVPDTTRVRRLARRDGISDEEAAEHIKKRDADNIARYRKAYGIDITDHSGFDAIINVGEKTPDNIAGEIIAKARERGIL